MIRASALLTALLLGVASAAISKHYQDADHHDSPSSLPTKVLHQFPPPTWIENLAVRKNGHVLLTQLRPEAALLSLSRPWSQNPPVKLLHKFPSVNGLLGIAEPSSDVFVVVGSNFSGSGAQVNGTAETWLVDFRSNDYDRGPLVKHIAKHPDMAFPNGVAALPYVDHAVLISDSALGLVWRLCIQSGKAKVAVKLPEMAPVPGSPLQIGVNGIKVLDGYLYWSNTFAGKIYRIRIDQLGNPEPKARPELVYRETGYNLFVDDFAHDERGFWATTNQLNTVFHVATNGKSSTVAGSKDSPIVARDTSCAFGRTRRDGKTLYVVTGNAEAKGGQKARGGKVVAIDTTSVY
ncbi:putative quinoprotein amine dehydrogenase beta chain-like protein [Hirsutella rhossiliensis]|uniref:Quinoprotein amine dehydrogenase beta chain-like protein n=1 Tax=Hirsutella rhossiliensis TaxID=111463 RepID=A0A9P8N2Y2_9HYPO|nr:putative quinoprotein amine dehydrogenase beta chain-like protein [Hirsutella rhossiliensis]KAH0965875.1 putative quinoprotein amine dehydrogenase beta chain-like protein [Hirsutella rhossiliensis]